MTHNPDCDGNHCRDEHAPVRLYPLVGGRLYLILCPACFGHENAYRQARAAETGSPERWPEVAWETAKPYPGENPNV